MPQGPTSPYFVVSTTSYGGRGAFATQYIPKGTLILSSTAPYSSVVCRKFRKEACAWCFAWSWEVARKGSWSISVQLANANGIDQGRINGTHGGGPGAGVWFCGEECKSAWLADGEEEVVGSWNPAGIRGLVNGALEKCLMAIEKGKSKSRTTTNGLLEGTVGRDWERFLLSLDNLGDISPSLLEETWEQAERLSLIPSTSARGGEIGKNPISVTGKARPPICPAELSEIEIDTTRFVLSGLLRKCIQVNSYVYPHSPQPTGPLLVSSSTSPSHGTGTWSDLLDLQDNTLSVIRSERYALAFHIRVWAFAKYVVHSAIKDTKRLLDETKKLLEALWNSVDTPRDTRTILGRETGNVFGLWDMAPRHDDSEMLGWGLYLFGSYLNHDCSPTVYKKRQGRAMEFYSSRDIREGEELCIEYVDGGEEVTKRRKILRDGWYFDCGCAKCTKELIDLGDTPAAANPLM